MDVFPDAPEVLEKNRRPSRMKTVGHQPRGLTFPEQLADPRDQSLGFLLLLLIFMICIDFLRERKGKIETSM